MDSSHAFALSDEELECVALEYEALPDERQAHLSQCAICQQRLAKISRLNDALVARFYRRFCPEGIQLSLYCADLLPADERMSIAIHLLECPLCAAEVTETRRFMLDVPAEPEAAFSLLAVTRRVIGVLIKQQAQLVTRSDQGSSVHENGWPRQYRANGVDLSLHLSRASNGEHMLLGILTSVDRDKNVDTFEGANVDLYTGSFIANVEQDSSQEPIQSTQIDDLGTCIDIVTWFLEVNHHLWILTS